IVVVNVKPFAPAIGVKLIGLDEAIEMIDVGGAALLGAAARNAAGVASVADPAHYPRVVAELRELGTVSPETRAKLAAEAFSPVAAFGGIVGVNRELDGATAREIAANSYEAVVAPGFSQAAVRILRGKPGLELLAIPPDPTEGMRDYGIASLDFKRVAGGLLVETHDDLRLDRG